MRKIAGTDFWLVLDVLRRARSVRNIVVIIGRSGGVIVIIVSAVVIFHCYW